MKFFKASVWRNFHSIQLLGSSNQKVFLSRPFGNLGIGVSASSSSLASALQKYYFHQQKFFLKKSRIFMFIFVLSYGITTTLLQILSSLRFPIHSVKGVRCCSRKKYSNIRKHPSWCFKKTTAPKMSAYFAYFPAKHPGLSSF